MIGLPEPAPRAPTDIDADPGSNAQRCWDLLAALHMLRAHLWIGTLGEPSLGLSVIVSLDAERGTFLIDSLREADTLVAGTGLYFDTQVEGRRLRFECQLVQIVDIEGGPAYLAADPRLVLDQQRRNAYRVRVPASLPLPAAIHSGAQQTSVKVLDLSTRGCSTRVDSLLPLDRGDTVRVELKLGETDLACSATVRHIQRIPGAARIGMEFDLNAQPDAHVLDQAVARLQREILRRRQA